MNDNINVEQPRNTTGSNMNNGDNNYNNNVYNNTIVEVTGEEIDES